MICNQKGFALALMVALLPIIIAAGLASNAVMTFLQIDQRYQYVCRSGGLEGQEKAGKNIDELLKLNPRAKTLIREEKAAQQRLRAAQASEIPPAIVAAEIHLGIIHARQALLKIKQLQFIAKGNLALQTAQFKTYQKLNSVTGELGAYSAILESSANTSFRIAPLLAVSPEGTDIAPTYRTDANIENKQALVQNWQYRLRVPQHLQSFLSGEFRFSKSCSVTVTEKGKSWVPKIKRDRSL